MKKSIENLPLTEDALNCEILRSYFIMYLLNNSSSPLLYKPDPTLFEWCYMDKKMKPRVSRNKLLAATVMV